MSDARPNAPLAAALMIAAMGCFVLLDAILKSLVAVHNAGILATVRNGVQVVVLLALVPLVGRRVLRVRRPAVQVGRGVCLVVGTVSVTLALGVLPMAQTYAIAFSAPLLAALLAAAVLAEPVGARRWLCIGAGFAGVLVALDPGAPGFGPALLLPCVLALANGGLHVLTRLARDDDPLASVLWSAVVALALCLPALPWTWEPLPARALGLLVLGGLAGTAGQLLVVEAFRRGETALVSPMIYSQIVWAALAGLVWFGETPRAGVLAGAAIVAVSGVALVRWASPARR